MTSSLGSAKILSLSFLSEYFDAFMAIMSE